MGRIVVSENITLDGVVEDPTGEEGSERGGWISAAGDEDRAAWAALMLDEARAAQALLLGRRSDEWFAARWPSRSGEWADRLNSMPKYVVSAGHRQPKWNNATVLDGEVATTVAELKRTVDGDIVVYGSARLVHALMDSELVDELRLTIYPVVLGAGRRLFGATGGRTPLELVESRTLGRNLVFLRYVR
ncbi:dihydrofolate reductase family protein [Mycolicibacterium arseniciresistens]|uniref:Dihydrofolate reductase family protein n=1 Tax=Mycolicibacterium arseniciresistens TaxID=3062257 RepID=A0ABT8UAS4_9MYCO|nr:dihydrofolate reductase family protein [Mycolicibacterium arseniciresistens]MDO3634271.1 dihydrofolate reductase family protein [Mycolicibacterium arseniciresistens]